MAIRHLSFVACDWCGKRAQPGEDAIEARIIASGEGFLIVPKWGEACFECRKPQRVPLHDRQRNPFTRPSEPTGGLRNSRED